MSRYLDADALAHKVAISSDVDFINKVTKLMIDAPSIDIVRCKECKHARNIEGEWVCEHLSGMVGLNVLVNPDDFCSYGERKDQ